ncbi:MAG: cytochrome C [Candidatus Kryptonium sp.]
MQNLLRILGHPDNFPIIILLFTVYGFFIYSMKKAKKNDERGIPYEADETDKVQVWPYLVRVEFIAAIAVMAFLLVWSIGFNAPLEEPANPSLTPNPSKAPWYFLGLQEMLVYFDPWIAGVLLPGLIIIGLMAIPYIDINPKGNGYYTFKERKWAIIIFGFGFLILWVLLIVVGTFFRGPGWNFFWPWEEWDPHKVVAITNVDLNELIGIPTYNPDGSLNPIASIFGGIVVIGYYAVLMPLGWLWMKKKMPDFAEKFGLTRYLITSYLLLTMIALPIKMILRWTLNVKYVWVTPWFNV